jgi:hypothetical protein
MGTPSKLSVIRKDVSLVRVRSTLDLNCEENTVWWKELQTVILERLKSRVGLTLLKVVYWSLFLNETIYHSIVYYESIK